jgi:hypothetical protein
MTSALQSLYLDGFLSKTNCKEMCPKDGAAGQRKHRMKFRALSQLEYE